MQALIDGCITLPPRSRSVPQHLECEQMLFTPTPPCRSLCSPRSHSCLAPRCRVRSRRRPFSWRMFSCRVTASREPAMESTRSTSIRVRATSSRGRRPVACSNELGSSRVRIHRSWLPLAPLDLVVSGSVAEARVSRPLRDMQGRPQRLDQVESRTGLPQPHASR